VIRFKDLESAEVARNNTEWLNELGNSTKLVFYQVIIFHYFLYSLSVCILQIEILCRRAVYHDAALKQVT
jgi:hypothetical protein